MSETVTVMYPGAKYVWRPKTVNAGTPYMSGKCVKFFNGIAILEYSIKEPPFREQVIINIGEYYIVAFPPETE